LETAIFIVTVFIINQYRWTLATGYRGNTNAMAFLSSGTDETLGVTSLVGISIEQYSDTAVLHQS